MPLLVNHPEADVLARDLAQRTGESVEEAIMNALRKRLSRQGQEEAFQQPRRSLVELWQEAQSLPDYDLRSPDEILSYDEHGLSK